MPLYLAAYLMVERKHVAIKNILLLIYASVLVLLGTVKEDNEREDSAFSQPMGFAFEQLCFITYDAIVLELMAQPGETSDTMFKRHADLE